jgi:hypothetical protein
MCGGYCSFYSANVSVEGIVEGIFYTCIYTFISVLCSPVLVISPAGVDIFPTPAFQLNSISFYLPASRILL